MDIDTRIHCPVCTTNGKHGVMNELPHYLFRCSECGLIQKITLNLSDPYAKPWTLEDISPEEAQQEMRNRQMEALEKKREQQQKENRQWLAEKSEESQKEARNLRNFRRFLVISFSLFATLAMFIGYRVYYFFH